MLMNLLALIIEWNESEKIKRNQHALMLNTLKKKYLLVIFYLLKKVVSEK
jgi:hypothetical protein